MPSYGSNKHNCWESWTSPEPRSKNPNGSIPIPESAGLTRTVDLFIRKPGWEFLKEATKEGRSSARIQFTPPQLAPKSAFGLMIIFLVALAFWIVTFLRHFARAESSSRQR